MLKLARMAREDGGGLRGERAVDEDGGLGHLALVHQPHEVGDEFLRALHREGGDEERALLLRGSGDLAREDLAPAVLAALEAVAPAIGRFADHVVEVVRRFGVEVQHLVVGPDVAREQDAERLAVIALDLHLDRGGAEKMTGVPETGADAGGRRDPGLEAVSLEMLEGRHRILLRVDRLDLLLAALQAALVQLLHFHFLDRS